MSDNKSFRDMTLREKIFTYTALSLLMILAIAFVVGLFLFGLAGVFRLTGVQYTSVSSLVIFVILFFLLSSIFDLFSRAIIGFSNLYLSGRFAMFLSKMFFNCSFTWLALFTVDEWMTTISIPFKTELVIVVLLFLIELAFEEKEATKKQA